MPHFSFLLYLLIAIVLCVCVNTFLLSTSRRNSLFDRILIGGNFYLGFHAIYVLLIRAVFHEHLYLDRLAPFALLYGPLLFLVLNSVLKGKISRRNLIFHMLAPIAFWIGFFTVITIGVDSYARKIYGYALSITVPLSLFAYTGYGFICNAQLQGRLKQYKPMIIPALLLMLFMCAICVVVPFYREKLASSSQARELLSIMVYSLMLATSLLILRYELFLLQKQKQRRNLGVIETVSYQRSAVPTKQLEKYRHSLEHLIANEKPFLNKGLSLTGLANILRIPQHHLTQVFSLSLGKTFSQYINAKRIEYACMLLLNETEMKVEEVALKSGFGTLISFHRQFKALHGCTPVEYRKKHSKKL